MHSNQHDTVAMGANHKRRRQLGGGEGSKIGQKLRTDSAKKLPPGGVKNPETILTSFMDGPIPWSYSDLLDILSLLIYLEVQKSLYYFVVTFL